MIASGGSSMERSVEVRRDSVRSDHVLVVGGHSLDQSWRDSRAGRVVSVVITEEPA